VTFSNIVVVSDSGTVDLSESSPLMVVVGGHTEYDLDLFYAADSGSTPNSFADADLRYRAPHLTDAYETYAGGTTGTGATDLSETLRTGSF